MKKYMLVASLAVITTSVLGSPSNNVNGSSSDNGSIQAQASELTSELREIWDQLHTIIGMDSKKTKKEFKKKHGTSEKLSDHNQKRLQLVKDVIEKYKSDIANVINWDRLALISEAFEKEHPDIAQLLLEQEGVNVNQRDNKGYTPLHRACDKGYKEIVELLLNLKDAKNDYVVNVNQQTNDESTPLHLACISGHMPIVELLLNLKDANGDYVVNFNLQNKDGYTPLHYACYCGHKDIVDTLSKLKDANEDYVVNFNLQIKELKMTPLNIACQHGYKEIVDTLSNLTDANGDYVVDFNLPDKDKWTPLHYACYCGHKDIVDILLKLKDAKDYLVKVNLQAKDGCTPLYMACVAEAKRKNGEQLIKLLIDRGATVDENVQSLMTLNDRIRKIVNKTKPRTTPSRKKSLREVVANYTKKQQNSKPSSTILTKEESITNSDKETLNQKEEKIDNQKQNNERLGSDVYEETKTRFFENIRQGNLNQVETLLKENPKLINAVGGYNRTPLVAALVEKQDEIAEFLLEQKGINLTRKDNDGNSALMYAATNQYLSIVENILQKIKYPSEPILERNKKNKNALELAITGFSKLNKERKLQMHTNHTKMVELLLNHLSSEEKFEEMCFAIENHLWDVATEVMNSGVDLSQKYGSTPPLILALKTKGNDDKNQKLAFIGKLIIAQGISLDATDENGCTALSYAVDNQYWDIIDLLITKEVQLSFKWVKEIKDQNVLDRIAEFKLKPWEDENGQLITKTNDEEQADTAHTQKEYKLKFMKSSLKAYDALSGTVKEEVDKIIKSLEINPRSVAKEMLQGNYKSANLSGNRTVKAFSAQPQSTKRGRVAYIIFDDPREVWIIEASGEHYDFMKKYDSLRELMNKNTFEDFNLEDNKEDATLVEGYKTESSENDSIEEEIINDTDRNSLFSQSISDQTLNIAQYLIDHNITMGEYITFLQATMDQIKQKR